MKDLTAYGDMDVKMMELDEIRRNQIRLVGKVGFVFESMFDRWEGLHQNCYV